MTQEEQWLLDEKYNGEKTEGFFADCARLEAGEPLAYLIGHTPFLHTKIFLDSHPLIPRAETEFWVEKAIRDMRDSALSKIRVLDLCAGSGCIGVAVLKALPHSHVDFIENDARHLPLIQKNIRENSISDSRARVSAHDLFTGVSATYDYILTNPPYIDRALNRTDKNVLTHEPHEALFGGHLGMELVTRIVQESPRFLSASGVLYIEHEPEQAKALCVLAQENGFQHCVSYPDQFGVVRYTRLSRT